MKQIFLLTFLIISSYLLAQSPVTIPYPEMQFYRVPAFKEIVDNELDSICQYWYNSSDNEWRRIYKYEFQYNNKGLLTKSIKWNWRYDEKYWKGETMIDFSYVNETLVNSIEYMWWNDSSNWVKKFVTNYEFDKDTVFEDKDYYILSTGELSDWQNRKFYYNDNWKLKQESFGVQKYDYEYDNKNRLTKFTNYKDAYSVFAKEFISKDEYVFNDDSSTMEHIGYKWKDDNWEEDWHSKDKYVYENNSLEKIIRYGQTCWPALDSCAFTIMDTYDFKYENDKLTERIEYFSTGSYDEKIECFYSEKTLSVDGKLTKKYNVSVFPNPTEDYLIIAGQDIIQIRVYSINGNLVYSKKTSSENESVRIDISTMHKGLYLFQMITKEGIEINRKIIKQ